MTVSRSAIFDLLICVAAQLVYLVLGFDESAFLLVFSILLSVLDDTFRLLFSRAYNSLCLLSALFYTGSHTLFIGCKSGNSYHYQQYDRN